MFNIHLFLLFSVTVTIICLYLGWKRLLPIVPKSFFLRLAAGSLANSVSQVIMMAKVEIVPLGSSDAVTQMTIITLSTLVAKLVFKETVKIEKWLCILLLLIGSCFIIAGLLQSVNHCQICLHTKNVSQSTGAQNISLRPVTSHLCQTTTVLGLVFGLSICFFQGLCAFATLYCAVTLKDHVSDTLVIQFWYSTTSLLLSSTLMFIFEHEKINIPKKMDNLMLLLLHSFSAGTGQVLYIYIVRLLSILVISIILYSEVPLRTLTQYLIVPDLQPIKGQGFDLAGCIIITLGLVLPSCKQIVCPGEREKADVDELTPLAEDNQDSQSYE